MQSGIDQRLPGLGQRGEGRNQVNVVQTVVGANALGQSERQAHDQMFVLVEKLVFDLDLHEEIGRVQVSQAARLFMLAGLLQIHAVTGTIERHLALLATALRTDAAVDRRAEAFLLAFFANRAAHENYYDISHVGASVHARAAAPTTLD